MQFSTNVKLILSLLSTQRSREDIGWPTGWSSIVMSCHFMSCHFMSCHFMSCHFMSFHVMSFHVMSFHVMSFHVMSCHVMSSTGIALNTSSPSHYIISWRLHVTLHLQPLPYHSMQSTPVLRFISFPCHSVTNHSSPRSLPVHITLFSPTSRLTYFTCLSSSH